MLTEIAALEELLASDERLRAQVALELTEHDALRAHLEAELHIDETEVVSPWHAAFASAVAGSITSSYGTKRRT